MFFLFCLFVFSFLFQLVVQLGKSILLLTLVHSSLKMCWILLLDFNFLTLNVFIVCTSELMNQSSPYVDPK